MKQIHIKISPELHRLLVESAKVHKRSLNSEVNLILENAIAKIPIVGTIKEDGVISVEQEIEEWRRLD